MAASPRPDPPILTAQTVARILSAPVPYASPEQERTCTSLVERLTPPQVEAAARTSYAYHAASSSSDDAFRSLATDEARMRMAARMVRRHLVQGRLKGDAEAALRDVRECLRFRREKDLDALRRCFKRPEPSPPGCVSSALGCIEEPSARAQLSSYEALIASDASAQTMVVHGTDVKDRAVVVKFPRTSNECEEEAYVFAHLWIAERAVAATEYHSEGREEKVVALLDFENYGESCRPPFRAIRRLIGEMQKNYPERLEKLVILEPPFWMRALFKLVTPFMDPDTREKVAMVCGPNKRKEQLSELVGVDQAAQLLPPDGKLVSKVDMGHYLRDVPFFASYYDK